MRMICGQEDANGTSETVICREHSPNGFLCTRALGHAGKHHAHDTDKVCYAVW